MRIGGIDVKGPAEEVLVLPRLDGDIIIKCQAVLDMEPFLAMCPEPVMPKVLMKGGIKGNDQDKGYLEQTEIYGQKRFAYMAIKSLEPSDIEWEKTSIDDPNTWLGWTEELAKAGLSSVEINRITMCVMQANSLDEAKLKEAREVFLLGQGNLPVQSSGPSSEQSSMPSGGPAKDSE